MEFKGTKGNWECVYTSDLKRAVRTSGGYLMTFWKPHRYDGQDKRYDKELKETQANQLLCSKAPEMLEMLKEMFDEWCETGIGENKLSEYMLKAKQLIKEATEI